MTVYRHRAVNLVFVLNSPAMVIYAIVRMVGRVDHAQISRRHRETLSIDLVCR
jgi:hypothetical protein